MTDQTGAPGRGQAERADRPPIQLDVDGRQVEVPDDGAPLSEVLRDRLGITSVKDGCSPQGQCGCCTVLVDGAPRVSCVTPTRRVRGRAVTTLDGLDPAEREGWAEAFCATGASQCGFCTPGIVVRLSGLRAKGAAADDRTAVDRALAAHLCRCTGWQTIHEAWAAFGRAPSGSGQGLAAEGGSTLPRTVGGGRDREGGRERDLGAAARRATLEGGVPQAVGPEVALGQGGFADDTAPEGALVAVRAADGSWAVGETLTAARARAGKVQGRRTTVEPVPPLALPPGDWAAALRTSWVEPAYLETDASWCEPGGEPADPLGNGGAFGGKATTEAGVVARRLADEHGRAVRVLWSREDTVRLGPKRPPLAGGIRADGSGVVRVVRTPGVAEVITGVAPGLEVEEVDVPGPPTSLALRGAGWVEAALLLDSLGPAGQPVRSPAGAEAWAEVVDGAEGSSGLRVRVACGEVLDEVVLRSYAIGAAHMALGWITSEGLAVDEAGEVHDLTVRSFGILRAADMPPVEVALVPDERPAVPGADAVFAAVAAAVWRAQGHPSAIPTGAPL